MSWKVFLVFVNVILVIGVVIIIVVITFFIVVIIGTAHLVTLTCVMCLNSYSLFPDKKFCMCPMTNRAISHRHISNHNMLEGRYSCASQKPCGCPLLKTTSCLCDITGMPRALGTSTLGAGNVEGPACVGPGPLPQPLESLRLPRCVSRFPDCLHLLISEGSQGR